MPFEIFDIYKGQENAARFKLTRLAVCLMVPPFMLFVTSRQPHQLPRTILGWIIMINGWMCASMSFGLLPYNLGSRVVQQVLLADNFGQHLVFASHLKIIDGQKLDDVGERQAEALESLINNC